MLGGGGHLRTEGQGQRKSDLVSRLSRTLKQRTITSLYVKFKTGDGFAVDRERALAPFRPVLPCDLGAEVPLPISEVGSLSFPACG